MAAQVFSNWCGHTRWALH